MEKRTREVALRERATPYDFVVTMTSGSRAAGLYKGRAYKSALHAYWQAINTLAFLLVSGKVEIALELDRKPFGSFISEVEGGRSVVLHKPHGTCNEWVTRGWTGNLPEKFISHIPGTLGLPRDPN